MEPLELLSLFDVIRRFGAGLSCPRLDANSQAGATLLPPSCIEITGLSHAWEFEEAERFVKSWAWDADPMAAQRGSALFVCFNDRATECDRHLLEHTLLCTVQLRPLTSALAGLRWRRLFEQEDG